MITYPGLFDKQHGGAFHPVQGINFIFMQDMLRMQVLFAARQFLTARCVERGLTGVADENPFIAETDGTVSGLYLELSLLSATLGTVSAEILLGTRRLQAQIAYNDFTFDLMSYAPWIRFPNGAPDLHVLVRQSQTKLMDLRRLHEEYKHTTTVRTAMAMGLHPRIGAGSVMMDFGIDLVVMIANVVRDM